MKIVDYNSCNFVWFCTPSFIGPEVMLCCSGVLCQHANIPQLSLSFSQDVLSGFAHTLDYWLRNDDVLLKGFLPLQNKHASIILVFFPRCLVWFCTYSRLLAQKWWRVACLSYPCLFPEMYNIFVAVILSCFSLFLAFSPREQYFSFSRVAWTHSSVVFFLCIVLRFSLGIDPM